VHAHIHRLVSVVKMATVLEDCTTEEQRSLVRFYGQKDLIQRIFIKKYFLFTVGSVCRVKRSTTGSGRDEEVKFLDPTGTRTPTPRSSSP
jgi:hypothetical protein